MRLLQKLPFIILLLVASTALCQERITGFHVRLQIDSTNTMKVEENINIIAEGINFKRGIIRTIPYNRKDKNGKAFSNPIRIVSVLQDGEEAEFQKHDKSGSLEIKIGNANTFLESGAHQYQITYQVTNQVGFFDSYDEIYWNVTGNGWNFKIDSASCEVVLPAGAKVLQSACYTGLAGSTDKNCTQTSGTNTASYFANGLQENEGLTVATGFTKGIVIPPPPPGFLESYGVLILAFVFMIGLLLYMANTWRNHGKDAPEPVIIPQFDVPQNLSPAQVGFYYKKRLLDNSFMVSLVSLATKGFIKITENVTKTLFVFKDTTYTLEKIKEDGFSHLPEEEGAIMNGLFSGGNKKVTADGKYQSKFLSTKNKYDKTFADEIKELKTGQNRKFLKIPLLLIAAFWLVMSFYSFGSVFMSALWIVGLLLVPVFLLMPLIVVTSIFRINFRYNIFYISLVIFITAICIGVVLLDITQFSFNAKVIVLFSLLVMLLVMAYVYLIKRPTDQYVALHAEIKGFLMYMKTAEEQQLQMFNSPKMTPVLFEKLLPYAMALGIEKLWGDKFKNVLEASSNGAEYQPSWYYGSNFSTSNFHNLSNSISSKISSSSAAPSSSGSGGGSWSSGSSGGGSSGGGGGGGGGGGW